MILGDEINKYTIQRGLLAFYEEKKIYKPVNDEGNLWALALLMEWDGLTDYKRFEYLTKVIDTDSKIRDLINNTIEACRLELDDIKMKIGGE